MLTKSQARLFFLAGTLLFSGLFLFLTIDTIRKVPAQTKQQNITEEVKRGKLIWDKNNCMGCHTIMGEGAYYAPELTKTVDRRGKVWLQAFLKDPQAMYPGDRKMVQYHFTDAEINDIIAFLDWVGKMDLNGFPPKPDIISGISPTTATSSDSLTAGEPVKFKAICAACHSVNGIGGSVGPALDTVGRKFDIAYLHKWIKDPEAVKPGTKMPKLPLTDAEIDELVSYLSTKK